jgi:hypothetical protein
MIVAFFVIAALLIPCTITAQVQNGNIAGTVTDPGGAVIQGAAVTLTEQATNLVLHGQTNNEGAYSFRQLLPGDYSVAVEKVGFQKAVSSLKLTVGRTAQVDLTLPVGNETQTVTIEADNATTLDTETSNLDYTVQSQQVDALPLNGRNPYGLAILSPGILPGNYFGVGVTVARGAVVAAATNNFESNGGIGGSNEVLLDGVSIVVCCQGQPAVTPSTEVVSQFKVVTSNASADYGRTSGAVLNIATKSGDNRLRGDVYDFLRNDKLDAANFFTKRNGNYPYPGHNDFRPPHRANQYGVFVGGPIFVPHLYNGRDKSFFTFGYEGIRNLAPTVSTATVPTNLMRQGIFTEGPDVVYDPTSYDPNTGNRTLIPAATCNGTAYGPGLCVPNFDTVAKDMLGFLPPPNLPGVQDNYSTTENVTDADNQYNFRIDHNFSDKQRTFVRGTKDNNDHTVNDLFNKTNGPSGWQQHLTAYLFAIGHVWTLNPSTVFQFSYGFARQTNLQLGNNFYMYDASKYGFSSAFTSEEQIVGLPYISIDGISDTSYSSSFNHWAHYTHSLNASAMLQRGKHNITMGYNGRLILENQMGLDSPTGSLSYDESFTGGPTPNSSLVSGQGPFDAWAAYLLGYPSSGSSITRMTETAFNQWVNSFYLQDDWRVTPKLTVNMGLRWDVETGFKERHNHWADFDPNVTNPISGAVGFNIRGGAEFLGSNGNPSRTSPTYYHELGPRFGFSYAMTPKTVARGGYGVLFLPTSERGYSDPNISFEQTTNMATSADGFTPIVTSENPFPTGILLPAGPSAGVGVGSGTDMSGFVYKNPVSYQQQWSFGLERSLARDMSISLNYVGGHGVDLPMSVRPNDLQPQYYGTPGDAAQIAYLQQQVPNPFYAAAASLAPGSPLLNPTVQLAELLTAFPQYSDGTISSLQNGSVGYAYYDQGSATYNALQATWLVHNQSGLTGSVSYIRSKALGDVSDLTNGFLNSTGNPGIQSYYFLHQYEHSILATDVPNRVAGTATYPLPFGKGKRFANAMPNWVDEVVGGWTINTIIDINSGYPLSMGVSGAGAFAGTRPMSVQGVAPLTSGSVHNRLGGAGQAQSYLNPLAFTRPLAFQLGNVPRSAGNIRGPVSFDDNASVIKYFPIHGDLGMEFRAEAFNIMNMVAFGLPNRTVGSSSFGYITSQGNSPRNVQLSVKIHF